MLARTNSVSVGFPMNRASMTFDAAQVRPSSPFESRADSLRQLFGSGGVGLGGIGLGGVSLGGVGLSSGVYGGIYDRTSDGIENPGPAPTLTRYYRHPSSPSPPSSPG